MKRPATQFYWGDWLNCKEVRVCSLAARGLGMDMLGFMRQGNPTGTLTHENGQPITVEQLAKLVGNPVASTKKLIDELLENGVPGRLESGALTSRRMLREEETYARYLEDQAENGRRGAAKKKGTLPSPLPPAEGH